MSQSIIDLTVENNIISISGAITLKIKIHEDFEYIGTQEIIIYDAAKVFHYVFGDYYKDDNGNKKIQKLIYFQYEYYLPEVDASYDYKSKDVVDFGGVSFQRDNFIGTTKKEGRDPKSDTYQLLTFLESKNFTPTSRVWTNRFVTMLNDEKTQELLISILEETPEVEWNKIVVDDEIKEEMWELKKPLVQKRGLEFFTILS